MYMSNAKKNFVGSSQHVFPEFSIKLYSITFSDLFPGKIIYVIKNVIKTTYNTLLWLLSFLTLLLSHFRIFSHFEAAITQNCMKTSVTVIMSYMLFFISFLMIQVIFQMNELEILLLLTI